MTRSFSVITLSAVVCARREASGSGFVTGAGLFGTTISSQFNGSADQVEPFFYDLILRCDRIRLAVEDSRSGSGADGLVSSRAQP